MTYPKSYRRSRAALSAFATAMMLACGDDLSPQAPESVLATDASDQSALILPPLDAGAPPDTDASTNAASDALVADAEAAPDSAAQPVADGTFASVYSLLQAHCMNCHGAGKKLDLSTLELAHAELVSAPAEQACAGSATPPPVRVVPNDPGASLLMAKLEGTQSCGKQMPIAALLPSEQIAVFRAWIAAGAPRE